MSKTLFLSVVYLINVSISSGLTIACVWPDLNNSGFSSEATKRDSNTLSDIFQIKIQGITYMSQRISLMVLNKVTGYE